MISEQQLNINSTDAKLLYDIRSEIRKTNEILTQLLNEYLHPIAKGTGRDLEVEEIKPTQIKPTKPKIIIPKRGKSNAKGK